jgi:hypothetical protein
VTLLQKKTESNRNDRDKAEKDLSINVWTLLFVVIGFVASWVNMTFIQDAPRSIEVLAFLSIIFTTMIPGIVIALINRYWGYGYLIGFAIAGIPLEVIPSLQLYLYLSYYG